MTSLVILAVDKLREKVRGFVSDIRQEIREEIANLILTDDDAFYFIMWSMGKGFHIISEDIEKGRDDEMAQTFKRFISKSNVSRMLH